MYTLDIHGIPENDFLGAQFCNELSLLNTQNVSATKIVESSSIQSAETKHGLRIQFLSLVVTIHEVWLNA